MIQRQLKLRLNKAQEATLNEWLWHLTGVYNWAIRKIELDAQDKIYHRKREFQNILAGHGIKIGIPSQIMQGTLLTAYNAWERCFKKLGKRPKLKGRRNRINSIPFIAPIKSPSHYRIKLTGLGSIRFHKDELPDGKIKQGRIVKRASGWYLCLFIDAEPNLIPTLGADEVGIDPGFKDLVILSTGEKIEHPREYEVTEERLAHAQRSGNTRRIGLIQEHLANQRKDRNHKLSRRLVSQFQLIAFSKDNHKAIARTFGKSVSSSSHGQLRMMLAYKCRSGGREFVEVDPRYTTKTCSTCGALSGPTGYAGLKVRAWVCADCGSEHDRDVNAAVNTLKAGARSAQRVIS